jgi:hypothetical protein
MLKVQETSTEMKPHFIRCWDVALFAWLKSHDWKYCSLIYYERKHYLLWEKNVVSAMEHIQKSEGITILLHGSHLYWNNLLVMSPLCACNWARMPNCSEFDKFQYLIIRSS